MHVGIQRPRLRQWQIAGRSPGAGATRMGRRLWWSAVLTVCCTFFSVAVGSVHAQRLNDPLVANGNVSDFFLISSDGQQVVYLADQDIDEVFELYSVPLGGGAVTKLNDPLVAGGNVVSFVISPDGQRVVYVANQDTDTVFELYSVPLGGGTVTKLNPPPRRERNCAHWLSHQPGQSAGSVPCGPGCQWGV